MKPKSRRCAWLAAGCAASLTALLPLPLAQASTTPGSLGPPRDETLYTSGTSTFSPANFNPLDLSSYTGTQGLLYEPLFLYDPVRGVLIPWLATSGTWLSPTSYRVNVRPGVKWMASASGRTSGELSAEDVAYSVELAVSDSSDPFHAEVGDVSSVTTSGATVTVNFAKPLGYAQWQEFLWHAPVLPGQIWRKLPKGSATTDANTAPVATGPMLLYSTNRTQACYRDNPKWWGWAQLHLSFKFQYLCDVVSGASGADLSQLLADHVDWSNRLLRGITTLAGGGGYGVKTYYPSAPYMLPGGTAWLEMNDAKPPADNVNFRLAVAYALDLAAIASNVYTGSVLPANPTGLLPELSSFVNGSVVKKYGFYFSASMSKHFLAKSGYRGEPLHLLVTEGRVDLGNAGNLIAKQLGAAGIHVTVTAEPLAARQHDVAAGNFDMAIDDPVGLASTPWSYFDTVYHLPLASASAGGLNPERDSSTADWALVQEAAGTPLSDKTALQGIYANLEIDFLQQLPVVPLWYSGAWFQANTKLWRGYPSSTDTDDDYTPVMWRGWLGATTTVLALAQLVRSR